MHHKFLSSLLFQRLTETMLGKGEERGELHYLKFSYYHRVFLGRVCHNQLTNSSYGDFKIDRRVLTEHKVG